MTLVDKCADLIEGTPVTRWTPVPVPKKKQKQKLKSCIVTRTTSHPLIFVTFHNWYIPISFLGLSWLPLLLWIRRSDCKIGNESNKSPPKSGFNFWRKYVDTLVDKGKDKRGTNFLPWPHSGGILRSRWWWINKWNQFKKNWKGSDNGVTSYSYCQ